MAEFVLGAGGEQLPGAKVPFESRELAPKRVGTAAGMRAVDCATQYGDVPTALLGS